MTVTSTMTTENPRPSVLAEYDPDASAAFIDNLPDNEELVAAALEEKLLQGLLAEKMRAVSGESGTTTYDLPDIAAHAGETAVDEALAQPEIAASEQLCVGGWKNCVPGNIDFANAVFERENPEGAIPPNWLPDRPKELAHGSLENYGWKDGATTPTPGSVFEMHEYTEADVQNIKLVEPNEEDDIATHEELVSVVGRKAINAQCDIIETHPTLVALCGEELLKDGVRGLVKELMQNAYRHAGGVTGVHIYKCTDGTFVGVVSDPCPERHPKVSVTKKRIFLDVVKDEDKDKVADDEVIIGDPDRIDHGRGSAVLELGSEYGYWIEPGMLEIAVPEDQPRTPLSQDEKHSWFRIGPEDIARIKRQQFNAAA